MRNIVGIKGEVIITYNNGEIVKLNNIIDFTIDSDTEIMEHMTLGGGVFHQNMGGAFNVEIICGKLEQIQPSEIKRKSVRRKIR